MTRCIAAIAALSLFQLQAAQDWAGLRALAKGSSLEVRREDKETFRGTLSSVSENQLILATNGRAQRFGRSTIRTVKVKSDSGLRRNALIGWLIPGYKTVYEAPKGPKTARRRR